MWYVMPSVLPLFSLLLDAEQPKPMVFWLSQSAYSTKYNIWIVTRMAMSHCQMPVPRALMPLRAALRVMLCCWAWPVTLL